MSSQGPLRSSVIIPNAYRRTDLWWQWLLPVLFLEQISLEG